MDWDDELYDDDGDVDVIVCPLCGESIYDESECCPHCGEFIVQSTSFLTGKSLWFRALWVVLVTFLIYQMVVWF